MDLKIITGLEATFTAAGGPQHMLQTTVFAWGTHVEYFSKQILNNLRITKLRYYAQAKYCINPI